MAKAGPLFGVLSTRLFKVGTRSLESVPQVVTMVLETAVFIALGLALAHWLDPQDPFGIHAQFPWLWLIPALMTLRYGSINGVLAAAMLLAYWFAPSRLFGAPAPADFPQQFFLGGLVLVLLCGQFADVWNTRLERVRAVNGYLDDRLKTLTRSHFLLRLSHERIEQELLVRPVTLRDLIEQVQAQGAGRALDASALTGCEDLLRLLAQSCELEDAAIHRIADGGGNKLEREPLVSTGTALALKPDDPLLALAFERWSLAHVQASDASLYDSEYLICAPITASNRQLLGMLVVRGMRFFALNQANLQLMAVLIGYFADSLVKAQLTRPILLLQPTCPPDFALELVRLHRLNRSTKISSALVGLVFERTPSASSLFEQVRRMRRSLDLTWEIESSNQRVMITLVSLAAQASVEGFLQRIEESFREQFDTDFSKAHIGVHVTMLSAAEIEWTLDDFLLRCKVPTRPELASVAIV